MSSPHCTGPCAQGRRPCPCPTSCGLAIAERPASARRLGLLERVVRLWRRWDLATRIAGLEALDAELRAELEMLAGLICSGMSTAAVQQARLRREQLGEQLDLTRAEHLRLRAEHARLDRAGA